MKKEEEETKREEENKEKKYLSREEILILKNHSILLQDLLEDEEDEEDEDDTPIVPLQSIDSKTLEKVLEYCKHQNNIKAAKIEEKPLKEDLKNVNCNWENEFINIKVTELLNLVKAANYLNIPELLNLTSTTVASLIKGNSPEQIRDLFGIENDFTAEEEAKIAEENRWCEEN